MAPDKGATVALGTVWCPSALGKAVAITEVLQRLSPSFSKRVKTLPGWRAQG